MNKPTLAIRAEDAPQRRQKSLYPEPFASQMAGRQKQVLGDVFGLKNFGVNRTTLAPNAQSALLHCHKTQDEFIYVLVGELVLITDQGEVTLSAGMCAGFAAGGYAHHLLNRSTQPAVYLEIGDRSAGDEVTYPKDDITAKLIDGTWVFSHKDGTAY